MEPTRLRERFQTNFPNRTEILVHALLTGRPAASEVSRYLWARVAEDTGMLELVWQRLTSEGLQLTYQDKLSGRLYVVRRPAG